MKYIHVYIIYIIIHVQMSGFENYFYVDVLCSHSQLDNTSVYMFIIILSMLLVHVKYDSL